MSSEIFIDGIYFLNNQSLKCPSRLQMHERRWPTQFGHFKEYMSLMSVVCAQMVKEFLLLNKNSPEMLNCSFLKVKHEFEYSSSSRIEKNQQFEQKCDSGALLLRKMHPNLPLSQEIHYHCSMSLTVHCNCVSDNFACIIVKPI